MYWSAADKAHHRLRKAQLLAQQVAKEKQITITVSIAPEGQEAQSKTLKVAEKANLMEVLKANVQD